MGQKFDHLKVILQHGRLSLQESQQAIFAVTAQTLFFPIAVKKRFYFKINNINKAE